MSAAAVVMLAEARATVVAVGGVVQEDDIARVKYDANRTTRWQKSPMQVRRRVIMQRTAAGNNC